MRKPKVLIVDDEAGIRSILLALLTKHGYEVQVCPSGESCLDIYPKSLPEAVLLDLRMPGMDGLKVMEELARQFGADCKTIIMTAHGEVRSAVEAMKRGAFDYLEKPFDNDELVALIARAVEMVTLSRRVRQLENQLEEVYGFDNIIGTSDRMKSTFALMRRFAATEGTVLVCGESGTGKELIVRAIHQASGRRSGPFIVVNCGAIPSSLIESEFFGHEAGAFTGATGLRRGKFEEADGGTLFLDEVGELTPEAQVKLLRVIEEGSFCRVGGNDSVEVDVRVMAATNRDLAALVKNGQFREDLFWRLHVLSLTVCPLRERPEDIPLLVEHFVEKYATSFGVRPPTVGPQTMELLQSYAWPGNVRELQNCIYSAMIVSETGSLEPSSLPERIAKGVSQTSGEPMPSGLASLAQTVAHATEQVEKETIQEMLVKTGGNREKAAEMLGIGRTTLYRKLKQYGID
jgi:two-component system NtrC family response regulator